MITPLDENIFSHQLDMLVNIYVIIPSKNKVDYKHSKIAIVPDKIYNILSGHEFYIDCPIKKIVSSSEYTSMFKDIEHYIWKRDNTIIKCHEKLFLILKLSCG